jgi:hypothetical protein
MWTMSGEAGERGDRPGRVAVKSGPDHERAYIDAMAIRFPTEAAPTAPSWRASIPMPSRAKRYPDDLTPRLHAESLMNLRAWKLWTDGQPAERTEEIVAVLESVGARPESSRREPLLHSHRRG